MQDFLLEIGTEEIPAGYIPGACSALESTIGKLLKDGRINYRSIKVYATPRRLAVLVSEVDERQQESSITRIGPPRKAAYDLEGSPTKAGLGFAKSQGVQIGDLIVKETPKGEYVAVVKKEKGEPTSAFLAGKLADIIRAIPFPKSMRWADNPLRFVRPIHWIVALFGEEVVEFEIGGILSSNESRGHRFLYPEPFKIDSIAQYNNYLMARKVFVDQDLRKETIREQLDKAVPNPDWSVKKDEDLLEEVTYLVECPKVICGTFEEKFLDIPDEVLITVMKKHQKYFSVVDEKGQLVNRFLVVSNMDIDDLSLIRAGNERVLRARLADAEFFFQSDRKRSFSGLTERLEEILFQEKLGTVRSKVERIRKICAWLAPKLGFDAQTAEDVDRAAFLCKNDLLTEMVYEFPNLQGIMGREYAKFSGETEAVGQAIYEHYLPKYQGDVYPQNPAGIVLSIADKIDTICGCFGVGLIPTGSADPYALRRQTNGMLSNLLFHEKFLNLEQLVEITLASLGGLIKEPEETKAAVLDFFKARMNTIFNVLPGYGSRYDLVDAILAHHHHDVLDAGMRIKALSQMCREDYFEPLTTSFKRVVRIIPPEAWNYSFSPENLVDPAERSLWEAFNLIKENTCTPLRRREYNKTMEIIAGLRGEVDRFFDEVLVMAEEEDIRKNRLALLVQLALFFKQIADFSRIVVEGG